MQIVSFAMRKSVPLLLGRAIRVECTVTGRSNGAFLFGEAYGV